ncbi:tetratricopeptide repeat protein [Lentisphaerota bacterium WC36G]|nr:tetratricopeptide repeat protein [Lentisphaerae bacterium WC36]
MNVKVGLKLLCLLVVLGVVSVQGADDQPKSSAEGIIADEKKSKKKQEENNEKSGKKEEFKENEEMKWYRKLHFVSPDTATYKLGRAYHRAGYYDRAIELYLKAVKLKNEYSPQAILGLGKVYELKKDNEKAMFWYKKGIVQNNPRCMHKMAIMYLKQAKIDEAIALLGQASKLGNNSAECLLGLVYRDDKKDLKKAREIFQKLANKDDLGGIYNLAYLLDKYLNKKDEAITWYLKAADKGDNLSYFHIAQIYFYDKKNNDKALEMYQKAADIKTVHAYGILGYLYYQKEDEKNAIKYFTFAANNNDAQAMYYLGVIYLSKDKKMQAKGWFTKAASAGNKKAQQKLKEMTK